MKRIWLVLIALAAVGLLLWGLTSGRRTSRQRSERDALLDSVRKIDLSKTEPQVADKIRRLTAKVQEDPGSDEVWGKLAMNLDSHDLKIEAVPLYKYASSLDPSDLRWPYYCGILLSETTPAEAVQWYERAEKINRAHPPLLVRHGDALFHLGRLSEAAEKYRQAINVDAQNSHGHVGLAQVAAAQRDANKAREHLQIALQIRPAYAEALNLLATIYRREGNTKQADQLLASSKALPEKTLMADSVYAELAAEGESTIWHRSRGRYYLRNGKYDEAIREFQTALQIRPNAQSYEDLGEAYSTAGKLNEAAQSFRKAIEAHPTHMNYHRLALVYARMGRASEAEQLWKKAIAAKTDFPEAHFNLAVVNAKASRWNDAIANLEHAVRIRPEYVQAHYHLALAHLETGNRQLAQREYSTLLKLDPNAAARLRDLMNQR